MVFRSHEASYSDGEDVYIWPFGVMKHLLVTVRMSLLVSLQNSLEKMTLQKFQELLFVFCGLPS